MSSSLFSTLNISRTDILSRLRDLDVVSNNLANVNTSGFKANRSNFQEMLTKQIKEGTRVANTQLMLTQGSLRDSENPLDWAIQGEGFFGVTLPNGDTGYTRDGSFVLDAERNLVNANGYPLVWEGEVPEGVTDINISPNGTVTALDADGQSVDIGTVQLTRIHQSDRTDRLRRQRLAGVGFVRRRPDRRARRRKLRDRSLPQTGAVQCESWAGNGSLDDPPALVQHVDLRPSADGQYDFAGN